MGPTWGPPGDDRTQVGPMLPPWTLLSGMAWSRMTDVWCGCNESWYLIGAVISALFCHSALHKNFEILWPWSNLSVLLFIHCVFMESYQRLKCEELLLAIISLFEMINVFHTFSAFMHLPRMFLSTDYLLEQRMGHVPIDFLYIRFTQ